MNSVHANGIELAFESFGDEADESILLIAGLGTQMLRWTVPFCAELAARGYRVIRFDNRDTGGSTHLSQCAAPNFGALAAALLAGQMPEIPYTLHDMAADAVGLLDALAIERAHVVGRSMGGMIAQIIASEHPRRVRSLTSIMSSTGNRGLPRAAQDVMAMMMRPARGHSRTGRASCRTASPSPAASPAPAIGSTKRRTAPFFWKKSAAAMLPAGRHGSSPRPPWPATVARASRPSACRRSSSTGRTTRSSCRPAAGTPPPRSRMRSSC
jgi:pimeloyl-ACP methyl ester carboxylesterase